MDQLNATYQFGGTKLGKIPTRSLPDFRICPDIHQANLWEDRKRKKKINSDHGQRSFFIITY